MVSRSDIDSRVATTTGRLSPFPACSLKAGYTARSNAILRTALQVHTGFVREEASKKEFAASSHKLPVSTETGSYAPCHWRAPGILNPQHPP